MTTMYDKILKEIANGAEWVDADTNNLIRITTSQGEIYSHLYEFRFLDATILTIDTPETPEEMRLPRSMSLDEFYAFHTERYGPRATERFRLRLEAAIEANK